MKYSSAEVKSGMLIFFSIALLIGLTFLLGSFMVGETKTRQLRYGYISGLEQNAPVHFAGREVGKVEKIEIQPNQERPILVTIRIADFVVLRKDSGAFIDTLGMMGEKIVELSPGSLSQQELGSKDILEGVDPIPMHLMIRKMNDLSDRMDDMTTALEPMLKDLGPMMQSVNVMFEEDLKPLLKTVDKTFANTDELVSRFNKVVGSNTEGVAKIMTNLEQTSANLRDMTHDLKFRPWRVLRKD
jgi:phospholipid/cholesterol/gamma-HCH transport system substrate-binding protein